MNSNYKILFKLTTRSRRVRCFQALESIYSNLANTEDLHVLISMDVDDKEMANEEVRERLKTYKNLSWYYGISENKIRAINRDLALAPEFDIIANVSDDQNFTVFGFDDIIRKSFEESEHKLDTFIHFHDGIQPRLATMSVVGVDYFKRDNYIYHESYFTEWCDNEAQTVSQRRNRYKYMGDDLKIMIHLHPYHGRREFMDALYEKNMKFSDADKKNYFKRQIKNFPA